LLATLELELTASDLNGNNSKTKIRGLRTYLGSWRGGRSGGEGDRGGGTPVGGGAPVFKLLRHCATEREWEEVR
jgi:hypothetical protein